jgi:hypothetical protein
MNGAEIPSPVGMHGFYRCSGWRINLNVFINDIYEVEFFVSIIPKRAFTNIAL